MSAEQIIDLYERHALEWVGDRSRMRLFFEMSWLDRFAGLIPSGGTVLDLGCGPGKPMAAYLLAQGFNICGIDSSPTMIALSRRNFPDQEWLVADMRKLALGRRFDGLLAWDSFFHLDYDGQRRMFPVFRAHAEPGAPLMFTSGPRHGVAMGSFRGEPLYHASLDGAEYRALLDANGFDVVDHALEDADCGKHTVWLGQHRQ